MNKPIYIAESLPKNKACIFMHWDFLDTISNTVECLFLTIDPEELQVGTISKLIKTLKNKKSRRISVRKKIEFLLTTKPGDIILNEKILSSDKYYDILEKFIDVDFQNAKVITFNELCSHFIKIENYTYDVSEFGNSLFYLIPDNRLNGYDYLIISHSEILKRFYLISSYVCNNLSEIAIENYHINKSVLEEENIQKSEVISQENKLVQKTAIYSEFETVSAKGTNDIVQINIKLNKNIADNEAYFWTRFVLTEKYRNSLSQMVLGLRNDIRNKPKIIIKWPINDFVTEMHGKGETLLTKNHEYCFLFKEIQYCHDDSPFREIKIEYDRDNRNERVDGSNPKPRDRKVKKPGNSKKGEDEAGGEKEVPEESMVEKRLSRGYLLPQGNTEKKEKLTQETKNNQVKNGKDQNSGAGGGGGNNFGTKTNEDSEDSVQNLNYLHWIECLKREMLSDKTIKIINSNWTNLLQVNQNISFGTVKEDIGNYGFTQRERKLRIKALERCFRNITSAPNSKNKMDKRLRKVHYISYLLNDRMYNYIEFESHSTGSECFWLLVGEIDVSVFLKNYIKHLHLDKINFNLELKKAIKSSSGSIGKSKKHPKYELNQDDKKQVKNETIEDIKKKYLMRMMQSIKDLD